MFGIGELRDRRGDEPISFNELADQLVAFAERSPQDAATIDALASYLAKADG
jgi:Family of unknown function (DUF6104)